MINGINPPVATVYLLAIILYLLWCSPFRFAAGSDSEASPGSCRGKASRFVSINCSSGLSSIDAIDASLQRSVCQTGTFRVDTIDSELMVSLPEISTEAVKEEHDLFACEAICRQPSLNNCKTSSHFLLRWCGHQGSMFIRLSMLRSGAICARKHAYY